MTSKQLTAVSLFTGIGGIDLAAHHAGFTTTDMCEFDPHLRTHLARRFPKARIHGDVTTLDHDELPDHIHLLHGGYPCQPFSVAGKQKGHKDERHLWPYMRSIIKSKRPDWVLAENVKGHVTLGLDQVIDDLEGLGYACWPVVLPAFALGAPHTRERLFVIAHTASDGCDAGEVAGGHAQADDYAQEREDEDQCAERCRRLRVELDRLSDQAWGGAVEPPIREVDDGVPGKLARQRHIKGYGNAVVPLQVYPILCMIADLIRNKPL